MKSWKLLEPDPLTKQNNTEIIYGKYRINKVADLDKHESIILMGVYNAVSAETNMFEFRKTLSKPACFNNPTNPVCINLILKNKPCIFYDARLNKKCQSNFHKLLVIFRTLLWRFYDGIISHKQQPPGNFFEMSV